MSMKNLDHNRTTNIQFSLEEVVTYAAQPQLEDCVRARLMYVCVCWDGAILQP